MGDYGRLIEFGLSLVPNAAEVQHSRELAVLADGLGFEFLGRPPPTRELEVLGLMAEGRSNAGIAEALTLTVGAVEKHIANILTKLRLPPSDTENRRVLAVLTYLREESS